MNNPDIHSIDLYGIPNCDTLKKARKWFADHGQTVTFHDFKKEGVTLEQLQRWATHLDSARLLNRQGTTWRKLSESEQAQAQTPDGTLSLLLQHHSAIKRPVVELRRGDTCRVTIGMQPDDWTQWLNSNSAQA